MDEEPNNGSDSEEKNPLEETLETEWMDEISEPDTHLRKDFRFSVRDREDCWVIIGNKKFNLCDLSKSGLGISAPSEIAFQIGQFLGDVLSDCILNIMECSISGLSYKMVHISPDTGDRMICGLSWLNPRPDTIQLISSAIQSLKKESFPEDNSGTK